MLRTTNEATVTAIATSSATPLKDVRIMALPIQEDLEGTKHSARGSDYRLEQKRYDINWFLSKGTKKSKCKKVFYAPEDLEKHDKEYAGLALFLTGMS